MNYADYDTTLENALEDIVTLLAPFEVNVKTEAQWDAINLRRLEGLFEDVNEEAL